MSQFVRYESAGAVARVTVDDGKVNVMSADTLRALHVAFDQAERDKCIVVLSGREGIFSAGFDTSVFAQGTAEEIFAMMKEGAELALRVLSFPTPVVVACNGHAFPMGAFLMLAADIRIGADGPFRIGLNEVAIGIAVPSFGLELARQRLLPAYFNRTALTGEMYAPQEARVAGFLDRVVPAPELLATANDVAAALTKIHLPSHALTKSRVRGDAVRAVRAAIDTEITLDAYRKAVARRPS
jgi:enoyl-CoA hydratase